MERKLINNIEPDYDLILYYYNSLKRDTIPNYNADNLRGMYQSVSSNRNGYDKLLVSMLDYVAKRLIL